MKLYLSLMLLMCIGCNHTNLIITHPTIRVHAKGHDDNINGAAVTVRVRWDFLLK